MARENTRQELAKRALISEGITSSSEIPSDKLGAFPVRNAAIVQRAVFDGAPMSMVARENGISSESVRRIALSVTRRTIGRYE